MTHYGLEIPGTEFQWGQDFQYLSRLALVPTQPPVQWVPTVSGGEAARAWHYNPNEHLLFLKEISSLKNFLLLNSVMLHKKFI